MEGSDAQLSIVLLAHIDASLSHTITLVLCDVLLDGAWSV
jgi:hypothetical protein